MTNEEHLALMDKLTPMVLGELPPEEVTMAREHLLSCDTCRREYREVTEGMVLLAISTAGPAAPARARERLLKAAQVWDEPRTSPTARTPDHLARPWHSATVPAYTTMRRPWWSFVPAMAALVLAVFAILLWTRNTRLSEQLQNAQATMRDAQARLSRAQLVAEAVTSREAQRVTLVGTAQKPQPSIETMYLPQRRALVMIAHAMPAVPEGKAYELWLLPANGAPPLAAGTFRPGPHGQAVMTHTDMAATPEAKGFAVTVESAAGSDKPTSPVIMVGL